MADDNNDNNRKAEEQRKAAADQQRQQQQREQNARSGTAQGSADNRAGADAGGYEEMERRAAEIEAHEDEKRKMFDEATDEAIDGAAPAIGEEGGGHFLGGMDIVDTRAAARTPANVPVQDPNIAAKRRIGEENRSYGRQTDRDVVRARERNPNDPTAMAEAAARR
jgi:ATPase subunit of ABC transporter with duplicated ATPase domains